MAVDRALIAPVPLKIVMNELHQRVHKGVADVLRPDEPLRDAEDPSRHVEGQARIREQTGKAGVEPARLIRYRSRADLLCPPDRAEVVEEQALRIAGGLSLGTVVANL